MTITSENVIPGKHGKVFGTNAKHKSSLEQIKKALLRITGIEDVIINEDVFPREITIHTSEVVAIKEIEDTVISVGFHAIPKGIFPL